MLHTRTEKIEEMHERRRQYTTGASTPAAENPYRGGGGGGGGGSRAYDGATPAVPSIFDPSAIEVVDAGTPRRRSSPGGGGGGSGSGEVVIEMPAQTQMQLEPASSSYFDARAGAVESVQSTLVELGSIFDQLGNLVAEQGHMLQRVDENAEDALLTTQQGHQQLQRLWRSVSSSRTLALKVFAVRLFRFPPAPLPRSRGAAAQHVRACGRCSPSSSSSSAPS